MRSPLATSPLATSLASLGARAGAWSVHSQQVARRNAMVASTALVARRRGREEVESYLADHSGGQSAPYSRPLTKRG